MEKTLDIELVKSFIENSKEIIQIETKISSAIAVFQKDLEEKRNQEKTIKDALKEAMINSGVKKFENDVIALIYVVPTTRTSIDTEKLKEEKPELWEQYSKTSEVSDSIRIKIK